MDLPPALLEFRQSIDMDQIIKAAGIAKNVWSIAKDTWSRETVQEILDGKVTIPDKEMNTLLATFLNDDKGEKLTISSHENRRLDIRARTQRWGTLEMQGTLEELIHNDESSRVVYRIEKRGIKNHGFASWIFSRVSLSLIEKLFGPLELSEDLPTKREGNKLTVNLRPKLEKSKLAEKKIGNTSLLHILTIEGVTPHEGYIQLDASLHIPEPARQLIKKVLGKIEQKKAAPQDEKIIAPEKE